MADAPWHSCFPRDRRSARCRTRPGTGLRPRAAQPATACCSDWNRLTQCRHRRARYPYLSPSHAAALRAGSIDGWVTWEPYVSIEEETGGWRIADGGHLLNDGFQVASITAIASKHALLPDPYAAIWSRQIGLPIDVSRKVAEEMRTHATRIDDAIIDAERVTIESYHQGGAAPATGTDIAAAFDRSVTP